MKCVVLVFTLAAMLSLAGCGASENVDGKVLSKVTSPNGQLDAVITLSSKGGATVPSYIHLYIRTKKDRLNYEIMKAERVGKTINLKWIDDNHLVVNMPLGQILSYQNFFNVMDNGKLKYQVSIDLKNKGLCTIYLSEEKGFLYCSNQQ